MNKTRQRRRSHPGFRPAIAIFSLSLNLCLLGCGGYSARSQKFLDERVPTQKFSDLGRHNLEHNKKCAYEISKKSDVFDFETGRSYAILFELPNFNDSSSVEIKSYCDCFGLAKNVFIPIALLLDKDFNKINEIKFNTHIPTFSEPVHFVAEVELDAKDKYVLIYSDPKRYGKPADSVSANVTHVKTERMDYIRKGMVKETYSTAQVGVWWKGNAVGNIRVLVKTPMTR